MVLKIDIMYEARFMRVSLYILYVVSANRTPSDSKLREKKHLEP